MKINFNNVRRNVCSSYNQLVDKLNAHITTCELNGEILSIPVDEIQADMDFIRQCIVAIACSYDENNPEEFSDISDEINVKNFNASEDDE